MKNLFIKILLAVVVVISAGCDDRKSEPKKSLNDGIVIGGKVMTIAHHRNLTAIGMIMGCMDNGYLCQF